MKEKRTLLRKNVVSHYRITETNSDLDRGRVMDITTEGMRLKGPVPLYANTSTTYEMAIPQKDNMSDSVIFDANVVWCRESAIRGVYDSGLRVWNISPEDHDYLEYIVDSTPTMASDASEEVTEEEYPIIPDRY